jgi:serine/threonine protein kinase
MTRMASFRSERAAETVASTRAPETWQIDAAELELGQVLGEGAFGVVRRGEWRGRSCAVKQIKKTAIGDAKAVADFEAEIGRMSSLQPHENVVQLYGVVELANGDVGAVVEFCAQGSLADALYGGKPRDFSDDQLRRVAYDAACGLMHLHMHKIIHRDVAARNVLLAGEKDLVAKVSDFGMARDIEGGESGAEQQTTASIGPIRWMAPEQLERTAYSRASDVFAFGVLLYEIFARSAPWPGLSNVHVITAVLKGTRMTVPDAAAEFRTLMDQCWTEDPRARPSMQDVMQSLKPRKK